MYRCTSFFLVLLFLWQFIGYGYNFSLPLLQAGTIAENEITINTPRYYFNSIPAFLSDVKEVPQYESMIFVGDVLLARNVEFLMRSKSVKYPFSGIYLPEFGISPAIIGNFEAAVPKEHVPTPVGSINFSVPAESIDYLSKAGFSHMSLANNHTFDYGEEGLVHTTAALSNQLVPFGHPNRTKIDSTNIIEVSNQRIALIGINALSKIDTDDLKEQLSEASTVSDYQVVFIHWGEEYALRHNDAQTTLAKTLVTFGADLIIGHHPHVVQGVDLIEGVPVFYSLGNYIFDQYFSRDVQEGLVLSAYFDEVMKINLIPVTSKRSISQPTLMQSEEHSKFLAQLAKKSHPELSDSISQGYITTDVEIATFDKVAIMLDINKYVQ